MATFIHLSVSKSIFIIFLTSLLAVNSITATFFDDDYIKTVDPKLLGLKKEKLTHFQVYWQDILSGPNPTSVQIVKPASKTGFGMVQMIDNALTSKPGLESKLVGRAQGFYALAAQGDFAALMVMNFAFVEGKYNGSTITVLGRNHIFSNVREMSVVGGSGLFRFARGYVEARTKMFNLTNGDATVEYTCYVLHY